MRPVFPKRALVTAGMPYANKGLHFGHIGGVFIPADCYARFLRDRIGSDKVLFVCGTDCYGSSIDEGYRKLVEEESFSGSVLDYVSDNHQRQSAALAAYDISLDIYEGSALGTSKDVHEQVSREIIEQLYENGWLSLESTAQFYDVEAQSSLNGRQVLGHCPVQGCKSQNAYADECDLGHQYRPEDLLNPRSTLTGNIPELRKVQNWYFDLPHCSDLLKQHVAALKSDDVTRSVVTETIDEFLSAPQMYVKQEFLDTYERLKDKLPKHIYRATEKGKASFELEFASLEDRDCARDLLTAENVRLRTGKTLVPFRITGNVEWGVPVPVLEGKENLTVWCWPESLWAPISFSRAWLLSSGREVETLNPRSVGKIENNWQDFWCSEEAKVYQFIGQDNIYFYGVAQPALWEALHTNTEGEPQPSHKAEYALQQTHLVANFHLLFLDKKASSSASVKPPMATDLLEYYTVEQLRAHFLALGLCKKAVSFKPKVLDPAADEKASDPVLRESVLLTNIFNRLARSCFYEAQRSFEGMLPLAEVSADLLEDARKTICDFEMAMYKTELHTAFDCASEFIRRANKYWSDAIKEAGEDLAQRRIVLASTFHLLRTALILMHPIVPRGCEQIFDFLNLKVSVEEFFSWETVFEGNEAFFEEVDIANGGHPVKELPPRFDFFEKHPSQFKTS